MRVIVFTGQYKKDLKLARRRHFPEDKLNDVIFRLATDQSLPPVNKDHALHGDYEGTRECSHPLFLTFPSLFPLSSFG